MKLYLVTTTVTGYSGRKRTHNKAFLSKRAADQHRAFKWNGGVRDIKITAFVPERP